MKKTLIALALIIIACVSLLVAGRKHITTEVVINAPAGEVWNVLVDFGRYPDWNPFIRRASGEPREGNTVEVTFQTRGSSPVTFTPKIILSRENEVLQWEGMLLFPGIFTGRHTFRLEANGPGKTHLVQEEDFSGILVPFFSFDSTVEGFTSMNSAIKNVVENRMK